jgi:hypothetical protein
MVVYICSIANYNFFNGIEAKAKNNKIPKANFLCDLFCIHQKKPVCRHSISLRYTLPCLTKPTHTDKNKIKKLYTNERVYEKKSREKKHTSKIKYQSTLFHLLPSTTLASLSPCNIQHTAHCDTCAQK